MSVPQLASRSWDAECFTMAADNLHGLLMVLFMGFQALSTADFWPNNVRRTDAERPSFSLFSYSGLHSHLRLWGCHADLQGKGS